MQAKNPLSFKNFVPHCPDHKKRRKEEKKTQNLIVSNMKYIQFYLGNIGSFKKTLCSVILSW